MKNGTLYTGVTSNLIKRIYQHKQVLSEGSAKKHGLNKMIYFELFGDMISAITREKQIKASNRKNKLELIESMNKNWICLYNSIL